ncbi:MAG TPA: cytochrome P450 [Luteolibacter sp.]|nr:cytochrome P450 [Luteolibacter sp.]
MSDVHDPFQEARQQGPVLKCPVHGEDIAMLLRHADVRVAAKDWQTFSSDAPFRVPIPSEEAVRSIRQLPIETNPPEHTEWRAIVEPFFERPKQPEVAARIEALIRDLLDRALAGGELDVIGGFALPLQSRALTHLLNVPESEAEIWIGWGVHVFKAEGGNFKKGIVLEDYLNAQFDRAEKQPGDDFFSALVKATFQGRPLTRAEMLGFGNLTFAGGRDTIIHNVTSIIAYVARHPEALEFLREDPKRIIHASEEFLRVFMPLTQIGRVCPVDTDVHGTTVKAGARIGLGWAAANFDGAVFDDPETIRLDRKPNPHLSFGFGKHLCLGAPHARLIIRSLLSALIEKVARIEIVHAVPNVEREQAYTREVGYEALTVRLSGRG